MTLKTAFLAAIALIAFAGNSVLCRLALSEGHIDPAGFTSIRLFSGALTLAILMLLSKLTGSNSKLTGTNSKLAGTSSAGEFKKSWLAPIMLFAYAALFSFAYISLDTGVGALVLFGMVQITMVVISFARGHRMSLTEWLGLALACAGLVYLVYPQLSTPSFAGFVMMGLSGVAWGIYTVLGQGSQNPFADTSRNFSSSLLLVAVLALVYSSQFSASAKGIILAITSGAITSGIGYAIWYAALPNLTTPQAGVMQLLVPVIAAIGGVMFAGELLSIRLVVASLLILGGILLVILTNAKSNDL